jgi:tripartite-type tricarboxylate transporter receptor subunit TctC
MRRSTYAFCRGDLGGIGRSRIPIVRVAEFPDVPTVAETISGFQATGWAVLVAPIGTPEAIIDKITEDLRKVTLDPELQRKLAPRGSYTNPMSAAETTAFVHKQQQTWQPILDEIAKNQR